MFTRWLRKKAGINKIRQEIKQTSSILANIAEQFGVSATEIAEHINAQDKKLDAARIELAHFQPLYGLNAPFYLSECGQPCFKLETGRNLSDKVFVITQPKAGTYLLALLIQKIGFTFCEVHVNEGGFDDYRGKSLKQCVEEYLKFSVYLKLEQQARLIRSGQFVVGHLVYGEDTRNLLAGFKLIFAKREARAALVSHMRFLMNPGRGLGLDTSWKAVSRPRERMHQFLTVWGQNLLASYTSTAGWSRVPGVLVVPFEEISGTLGSARQIRMASSIAHFVGAPASGEQVGEFLGDTIGKATITWSGRQSSLEEFWSDACENWFLGAGGAELNEKLGYPLQTNSEESAAH